jgi:ASC-1-like (ASCH) protein
MIHYKKVLPEYFEDLASGKKKFELRLADWECKVGDVLILREYSGGVTLGENLEKP